MKVVRKWIDNARPVSLMQSLLPALLAAVLAAGHPGFNILTALLAIVGIVALHFSMNLADDYYDYKADVMSARDRVIRKGFRAMTLKYPYLTDGSETPRTLMRAILCFFALSFVCGAAIFLYRIHSSGFSGPDGAWWIIVIAAIAVFLGVFYSAPPLKLGYRGLGEPVIGLIFGPLLMMGCYYATAGSMDPEAVCFSIPVGLLVMNILYTHSLIDIEGDRESNKMTLARLFKRPGLRLAVAWTVNLLPYILVVAAAVFNYVHQVYLTVLLMLPRSLWLCWSLRDFVKGKTGVPEIPPLVIGSMKDWEKYKAAGIDWFMMRWIAARNILGGFCILLGLSKIVLLIFG